MRLSFDILSHKKSLSAIIWLVALTLSLTLEMVPYAQVVELLTLGMVSILAIVISVGLLSVQLAASEYTPLAVRSKNNHSFIFKYFLIFTVAISFSVLSYILISSTLPSESLRTELPLQLGTGLIFATSISVNAFAVLTIQDLFDDALSAIDRETILENVSGEVGIDSIIEYINERNSEGDAVRHPLLVIYIMAKEKLTEGDTHGSREAINHLTNTTKNILTKSQDYTNSTITEDGMKDLFQFWTDLGNLSVERDMRTIVWYWEDSFQDILKNSLENAPAQVVESALSTYREVTERVIHEIGLGDNPDQLLCILKKSINQERWDVFGSVLSTSHSITVHSLEERNQRFSDDSEDLLDEMFDSWGMILESDISDEKMQEFSEQFDENISEYIDIFSNRLELHNIELMESHSYYVSNLEDIGVIAANNGSMPTVKIVSSMLLDLFLSTRNPKRTGAITYQVSQEKYAETILKICEAGGRETIEHLFSEIGDLPRLELEEGDSKLDAWDELASELDEKKDDQYVRYNGYYRGRDILQELLEELAEEADIKFEPNG